MGRPLKSRIKKRFHLFQGIEPDDEARGLFAVVEAMIEFVAGEAGDFAFAGHGKEGL